MTAPLPQLNTFLAGRYEVDREIGRGGMATVFLARDVRHGRAVALKVLDPELGAVLGSDRFLAEIRVTANLQHPHLLPLFDSGEANGLLFYVMPYVAGESLRARLEREKQLPVDEAVRIAVAVASALDYAHRNGVIHRDLKPENILLQAGQPVVADFGIALAVSKAGGTRITQTGLSLGTPQYMSPEQATGDRVIDGRSDVYSLAAVTYEMLVGEPPHTGHTMQAVIARVLTERPRGVRTMRPNVSEQVALSVERGLEKLPADRWSTAREFADGLQGKESVLAPKALGAGQAPNAQPRGWRARVRDPVLLTVAGLAIATTALALWSWRGTETQATAGFTVRVPINIKRPGGGLAAQLAISPDGKRIAYVEQLESGASALNIREVGQLEARQLPGTERGIAPFFSANGEWVGFLRQGGRDLLKVAVSGGAPILLAQVDGINGAAWTPNGMIVASIRDRLVTLPEAGGTIEPLMPLDTAAGEIGQRNPRLLDDGETLLYLSWRGNLVESRMGVLSLTTRKVRYIDLRGATPIGLLEGHLIYASSTGSIMAVPFDLERVRLLGTPMPVIDEVDVGGSGAVRAALSYSGSLIYAVGSPAEQIVRVAPNGTTTVLIAEPRNYEGPRFSPDGKRLAFSIATNVDNHIWIYDIASSTLTRLTQDGTSNTRAEWTLDGKRVLFLSNRGGRNELWVQNADFSGTPELVESMPGGNVSAGVFAPPDGRMLAFWGSSPRYPVDILYRNLSGDTSRKPIANTSAGELSPKFSRDGKWIAYASNQDGALQVYVQPFPPTGARHKVTSVGGMTPVWSHDGKHIYYALGDRVRVATIRTTPEFAVLARDSILSGNYVVTVPPHPNFDVSRDGDFVLLRPVDTGEDLVFVHDWKYELRERTRPARRQ